MLIDGTDAEMAGAVAGFASRWGDEVSNLRISANPTTASPSGMFLSPVTP